MTDSELAQALLAARGGTPLLGLDVADAAQAYRVQALVIAEIGPIGGWKVGAPGPDGPISCAPMPAAGLFDAPHDLDSASLTQREVESEICFRLCADLPPRSQAYGRAEVMAAIGSCHPGIEVLQSRFADPDAAGTLAILADFIQTGAYVMGAAIPGWHNLDFSALPVTQTIDGANAKQAVGNPAGDMIRLVVWLANEGAIWAGGLRAGQVVTCGSWTGKTKALGEVQAVFGGAEPLVVKFR